MSEDTSSFIFLIQHDNNQTTADKRVLSNATVEQAHHMAHVVAGDWAEAHAGKGLHAVCGEDSETGLPTVTLMKRSNDEVVARIAVIEVEVCEPVVDPMDLLTSLFGRALGVDELKAAPEAIKEILTRISNDPNAPAALREIIKQELAEDSGAPSGATVH